MIINLRTALLSFLVLTAGFCFAQAPIISYTSPQTFTTGTAITPVKPTNTGGAVPGFSYGQVSTFAGTAGAAGNVNATGAAARFSSPAAITIDASGNLFLVDAGNNLIRKVTNAGVATTYAGSGGYVGTLNGPAAQVTFGGVDGIAVDASENVYVCDQLNEIVRKITPAGVVSTLAGKVGVYGYADGQDTSAIFSNPYAVAIDKSGNLYVSDVNNYLIRKITPTGLVSTVAGTKGVVGSLNGPAASATFSFPTGIAVDATGNLYVADQNQVRKISTDGTVSTFAGSVNGGSADGVGTAARFNRLSCISIDPLGNLYVTDGNYTIRKITPDATVTTLAGTTGVTGTANGVGPAAQFGGGIYAVAGASGFVFVTDGANSTIRELAIKGYGINKPLPTGLTFAGATGTIGGTPVAFSPATDYTVTGYNLSGSSSAKLNITITGTLSFPLIPAKIYGVADFSPAVSTSGAITYISSNTAVATVVSDNIHVIGVGTSTITATNGSTTLSEILTVNTAPLTIIADNKSKNFNAANPALTITYDGFVNGDSATNFTTQPTISTAATATSLPGNYPINISGATDKNYTITFVAGTMTILGGSVTTAAPQLSYPAVLNYSSGVAITPVAPTNTGGAVPANAYGQITDIAGTPGSFGGSVNGTGMAASFRGPSGVALDAAGNLYIADNSNNLVRKITPAGVVTTYAGMGANQVSNFVFPNSVTVDKNGNVYVADSFNNEIKIVSPQGVVSIFAGGGSQLDGQGTQASFSGPSGITIDRNGNFYVADQGNDLIRMIKPSGLVSTLAGQQHVSGSANGQGAAATFSRLNGIAVDTSGNVYVTDGNLVRKMIAGGLVSTLAGSGAFGAVDGAGTAASFTGPPGIAAEPNGIVYVMEENRVRKITPGGVVSTIIGTANPSGTVAQNTLNFIYLGGATVDPSGNLYTCDIFANFIAKITATGYTIDKTLPAGLTFDATTGKVSGTPTAALPPTFFTINAYNLGGESTSVIKLSVTASSVAALSALKISAGTLSPAFATTQTTYTASVPYATSSITLTPTSTSPSAVIKVNGTAVASGSPSGAIALSVGANVITTVVTAQDSVTTKTYTLTVTRPAPSTNCNLSALTVSKGTLAPAFAAGNTTYSDMVTNGTTSVTLTPTTQVATSTVTVNGTTVLSGHASGAVTLAIGSNTVTVVVTAQDGVTKRSYTLKIIRPSTNAKLAALKISSGTLTPAFNTNTVSYTASVTNTTASITVTPTVAVTGATITVNGTAVASGAASAAIALSVGSNTITTIVTAQDGVTTDTYTITVTRPAGLNIPDAEVSVQTPTDKPLFDDDVLIVHEGISPNGDGVNDFLLIDGILAYPDNNLKIMNRNGQLVYEAKGYDNATKVFDGHSNKTGQMQLPGTYFYELDYTANGVTKHKTGFLVLKY